MAVARLSAPMQCPLCVRWESRPADSFLRLAVLQRGDVRTARNDSSAWPLRGRPALEAGAPAADRSQLIIGVLTSLASC